MSALDLGCPIVELRWEIEYPRRWSASERRKYLAGHTFSRPGSLLDAPGEEIVLDEDEYLPMGDNTRSSLDGRYFGGVDRDNIIGPAFMVYWPFNNRWGLIE